MVEPARSDQRRPRITLDVDIDLRRRLRLAAARRDQSVRQYVLEALSERLEHDLAGREAGTLTAATDPVLGELWDNERDATYDSL